MSNATRWYASREQVKAAVGISGSEIHALLDSYIEAASEGIERLLESRGNPRFIPNTETRLYPWPQLSGNSLTLYLKADLLSVTELLAAAQDSSPTEIVSADYFLEPVNHLPYRRIEIDLSSSSSFFAGQTSQRSISVAGSWGHSNATKAAGTVVSGLAADAGATSMVCSDASLIDVGHTLGIESEQLFVSERSTVDSTANLNDTLVAQNNDVNVTLDDATKVNQGEIILIESERMLIESISGNDLTVKRAVDGSTLAAHSTGKDVYAFRTLTVVRGVNGTTAATHADTTAVVKYAPPADIATLCLAEALALLKQGQSGWTGQIGGGEGVIETRMFNLEKLRDNALSNYGIVTL